MFTIIPLLGYLIQIQKEKKVFRGEIPKVVDTGVNSFDNIVNSFRSLYAETFLPS